MSRLERLLRKLLGRSSSEPPGSIATLTDFDGRPPQASAFDGTADVASLPGDGLGPDGVVGEAPSRGAGEVPKAIGHYRLLTKLGHGGMGVVYKAQDTRLGRSVALKFLSPHTAADKTAIERFRLEARAASALNHPNICTIYDIGEYEAGIFIAMELLEGQSLRQFLGRGDLAPARLLSFAIQLADGVEAAHSKGIVHRDLKPENLFVLPQDRIKILDFGLAKLVSRDGAGGPVAIPRGAAALTTLGSRLGTCAYMSPEQARGEEVDVRTDLFSFGAVLYEMAARKRAFTGGTAAEISAAVLTHTPVLPQTPGSPFQVGLQRILDKALEKSTRFRYQHASDLAADLRRLERDLATGGVSHLVPPRPAPAPAPPPLGRRVVGDLMKAVVVATLALLAHQALEGRASGKLLQQFQLAIIRENVGRGDLDEEEFEAGGRYLPLVVDISALHPDKRQPTDRPGLDTVISELQRHGARAIGIDLSFDELRGTDFEYLHKWLSHKNVRIGVYRRAVERREAWLGRPDFADLAAGIAVPADNPQHAFAYSRRWFLQTPASEADLVTPQDCSSVDYRANCKEDLIQLPVALWLASERERSSEEGPARSEKVNARLRKLLDTRQPRAPDQPAGGSLEFGTYVIDYSYLKELRRDLITLDAGNGPLPGDVAGQLFAHRSRIADRLVLVGDLEDTSDQLCHTQGMKPLPGVLVHACSLATLNRGMLFESNDTLGPGAIWAAALLGLFTIAGLRVLHATAPSLHAWPYQYLEILVFGSASVAVIVVCRWLARSSGVVWPHFLWVSGGLFLYAFLEPLLRAVVAAPRMLLATFASVTSRTRGG